MVAVPQVANLATEAAENDLLDRSVAQGIVSLNGAWPGNWLTREQARDLLAQPEIETTEGKRDRAILAVLLGCALRRSELAALECAHIQQRDGRWVFVDLVGKGKADPSRMVKVLDLSDARRLADRDDLPHLTRFMNRKRTLTISLRRCISM